MVIKWDRNLKVQTMNGMLFVLTINGISLKAVG